MSCCVSCVFRSLRYDYASELLGRKSSFDSAYPQYRTYLPFAAAPLMFRTLLMHALLLRRPHLAELSHNINMGPLLADSGLSGGGSGSSGGGGSGPGGGTAGPGGGTTGTGISLGLGLSSSGNTGGGSTTGGSNSVNSSSAPPLQIPASQLASSHSSLGSLPVFVLGTKADLADPRSTASYECMKDFGLESLIVSAMMKEDGNLGELDAFFDKVIERR